MILSLVEHCWITKYCCFLPTSKFEDVTSQMHYQEQTLSCCLLSLVASVNVTFAMLGQEQIEAHYPLNSDSIKIKFHICQDCLVEKHLSLEYQR